MGNTIKSYNYNNTGYLKIIIGPMFSGKTSKLIKYYKENKHQENIIAINYIEDIRYHPFLMTSHNKNMIPCIMTRNLCNIKDHDDIISSSTLLINEAQFFDDLYIFVTDMINKHKKHIIIAGLDSDYNREKFGQILDLIPLCDEVEKLYAKCNCGNNAIFSKRMSDEDIQKVIGHENYLPVCRNCY